MPAKQQQDDVPVYLFTGFLEAGKTRFIQETLEDPRFNTGERTLLLLCEEGEEEYDSATYPCKDIFQEVLTEEAELNPAHLQQLLKQHRAERVIIEYNGMWQMKNLFERIPENWTVYQEMFFVDATTFLNYNANMRSLVVDKLNTCELVVFNRFQSDMDKMTFHKIVRGVSRRSDIAYEYADGKVEYDDIEDPLPFDINAPVIQIADQDYALWYRDLMEDPNKYEGKTVKFRGIVAVDKKFPKNTFAVGRHVMTCCVEDITYSCVVAEWNNAFALNNRQWVNITASIHVARHKLYRGKGPVLTAKEVAVTSKPEQEVATFY
jgi:uncharacterized membrane protein YcgQ (UPF0703/DUF1980 family)